MNITIKTTTITITTITITTTNIITCAECPFNLFDEEMGCKCCQFGSIEQRGFNPPCEPMKKENAHMKYWEVEFECDETYSMSGIYSFFVRLEKEPTMDDIKKAHGVYPHSNGLGDIVRIINITDELEHYEEIPDEWYKEWLAR
jgi:hypothetical protein